MATEIRDPKRLRFGIMCRGTVFPAWQAACLRELLALGFVDPALLILDDAKPSRATLAGVVQRVRRKNLLWTVYERVFHRRSQAMRPVDLGAQLAGVPVMRCATVRKGRYSQYFNEEDLQAIREQDLDFILRFAFGIIRGEVLSAARYGVWSFHHGDEERFRGSPPCFWEIYEGDDITGSILQRLTDQLDGGVVLYKGFFRTISHSYQRNRDQALFGGAEWPARVCKDIMNGTAAYLEEEPSPSTAPIRRNPTARQVLRFLFVLIRNFVTNQARALLRHDQWNIGIIDRPIEQLLLDAPLPEVRWLPPPPRSRYLADPFAIMRGESLVVLVEDFNDRVNHGNISWFELNGGTPSPPRKALDLEVHASYPYLFEHAGEIFCVPETAGAHRVDLFKCSEFPATWQRVATLVQGVQALDPTVFRYGGLWWLFCSPDEGASCSKLLGFYAKELLGPWRPHKGNPLKTDIRSSRPAGRPFWHGGSLYRPAQDGSETYGGAVVLTRVLHLTPTEFREEVVRRIAPDPNGPYPRGIHTLSEAGSITLIDAKRRVFMPSRLRRELSARLRSRPLTRHA